MAPLETYGVQRIQGDGTTDRDTTLTLEATSPLVAGQQALGEPLSLSGTKPKAIVRWLNETFVPCSVTLYEPQTAPFAQVGK
jgi:hypothetical protein